MNSGGIVGNSKWLVIACGGVLPFFRCLSQQWHNQLVGFWPCMGVGLGGCGYLLDTNYLFSEQQETT
jgi:hypothetical protein